MLLTGAEILAHVLIEQGATTVFGYPGGAVLPIYDALYQHQDTIHHYITAHEQGAAHAADGYARATGKVGVVLATSGPGSTNLVTGIATAYMDSIPLVAITGNVGASLIGRDSFQEVYTMGITMPITKHNYFVQDVADLAATLREAFAIANSGRKGPVLIDITKDAQANECEFEPMVSAEKTGAPLAAAAPAGTTAAAPADTTCNQFTPEDITRVAAYLAEAESPLVVFGGGVISSDASQELYDLVHKLEIPSVHTIMGTGALGFDDPFNEGLVGMHGFLSGNWALEYADLVLAIGFRFSDRVALNTQRWAPNAKIVQIDIDRSEVDKNIEVDYALIGDIKDVLAALIPAVEPMKHDAWTAQIHAWRSEQDYLPQNSETVLKPHQIVNAIAELAGEDALIVTDVGQHQMWAAQYCQRTKPRSFLTSGGLGTMGFGYGAALGAQVAVGHKKGSGEKFERPVVHITGDGSFHMNLNEACTAVTYNLPVLTVIFNNSVLGMVRQWQTAFYDGRYSSTTLDRRTDYVKVAEGFGATGYRATNIAEFRTAFDAALRGEGPAWIECVIDRDERVLPMIPAGGTVHDMISD
ncbi:MAG: biosynthetic-type acetolactate synthase large subunit [Coriobacteriales bacterium]|jgi:acetolactate synthase-1/2/3 large subunit|nr:biosynthetic-type acetolactate synthase large subunit [Coriobacteriales bacterium]